MSRILLDTAPYILTLETRPKPYISSFNGKYVYLTEVMYSSFPGKAPTEDKALTQVTFAEMRSTLEWWSAQ